MEIQVPTDLSEITLGQYQEYTALEKPTEVDTISIFMNIDRSAVKTIKATSMDSLVEDITKLFKTEQRFLNRFKISGKEFGFIPKLDDITYGENKDISSYMKWDTMHMAMAVMYRPIILKQRRKYLIEDYEGSHKYSEIMKSAPMNVVMGAMLFFSNLMNDLLNYIPNYLEQEENKRLLESNGVDIQKFTHLLKGTLQDLKALQNSPYINV